MYEYRNIGRFQRKIMVLAWNWLKAQVIRRMADGRRVAMSSVSRSAFYFLLMDVIIALSLAPQRSAIYPLPSAVSLFIFALRPVPYALCH